MQHDNIATRHIAESRKSRYCRCLTASAIAQCDVLALQLFRGRGLVPHPTAQGTRRPNYRRKAKGRLGVPSPSRPSEMRPALLIAAEAFAASWERIDAVDATSHSRDSSSTLTWWWWCRWCGTDLPAGSPSRKYCSLPCAVADRDDACDAADYGRGDRARQEMHKICTALRVTFPRLPTSRRGHRGLFRG